VIPFVAPLILDWTFFGLTPIYKVQKQEQIFDLVYHSQGGFTYSDVYHMPIYLRHFYIKRLDQLFKKQNKDHEAAMRKTHSKSKASPPKMRRR
jgi:hypothetical protein